MLSKKNILMLPLLYFLLACLSSPKQNTQNTSPLRYHTTQDSSMTDALKIAYTGNMGVCIEHGDKTVIIDGLHEFYNKAYLYPTPGMVTELIQGKFKNFSSIECCLFTHLHGDHFSGNYSKKFLEYNKESIIAGSYQIREGIEALLSKTDSIPRRINVVPYDNNPHIIEKSGIKITAIQCDHSSPKRHGKTQNIAYVVSINDYNILHVGDTDWNLTLKPFKALDIKNKKIDVAVLPYWLLLEPEAATKVNTLINPKYLIASHIPPNFSKQYQKQLRDTFSNITLLTNLGKVHYYKK